MRVVVRRGWPIVADPCVRPAHASERPLWPAVVRRLPHGPSPRLGPGPSGWVHARHHLTRLAPSFGWWDGSWPRIAGSKAVGSCGVTDDRVPVPAVPEVGATYVDTVFDGVAGERASLRSTTLEGCTFTSCALRLADVTDARLIDCTFVSCDLMGVDRRRDAGPARHDRHRHRRSAECRGTAGPNPMSDDWPRPHETPPHGTFDFRGQDLRPVVGGWTPRVSPRHHHTDRSRHDPTIR